MIEASTKELAAALYCATNSAGAIEQGEWDSITQMIMDQFVVLRRETWPVEPVAWRWRPRGATNWIYDPSPEWRVEHLDSIEVQPLYDIRSMISAL